MPSWQTCLVLPARDRLFAARLYLICDEQSDAFLEAALRGGVDIVQLRMKSAPDERVLAVARRYARLCSAYGALLVVNDRTDLALEAGADGAHGGQGYVPARRSRSIVR